MKLAPIPKDAEHEWVSRVWKEEPGAVPGGKKTNVGEMAEGESSDIY